MMKNAKCYGCIYFNQCKNDSELESKCAQYDYALFATEADKALCDMMCGEPEDD